MNALDALMHMHDEDNRISQIRNVSHEISLIYDEIMEGKTDMNISFNALISEEWELGVTCEACNGDGEINVECACRSRPLHSLIENPCCGGWNQATCTECDGEGIRWSKEY